MIPDSENLIAIGGQTGEVQKLDMAEIFTATRQRFESATKQLKEMEKLSSEKTDGAKLTPFSAPLQCSTIKEVNNTGEKAIRCLDEAFSAIQHASDDEALDIKSLSTYPPSMNKATIIEATLRLESLRQGESPVFVRFPQIFC